MKKLLKSRYFGTWIVLTIATSITFLLVYVAFQQLYRQNANDPQIRIAQDVVLAIEKGANPNDFNTEEKINIAESLSPFIIVYDADGIIQASTGVLDQSELMVPPGVLGWAEKNGENRVTWQPQEDVRTAIVALPYYGGGYSGFVVVGRSLREVDQRICNLGQAVLSMWIASLLLTACAAYILERSSAPKTKKKATA